MSRSRWIFVTCFALLLLPITFPAGAVAQGRAEDAPSVAAAVQVTQDPNSTRAHSSPQLAVNPTNGELVIVESEVRHEFSCDVHISTDEGRTWSRGGSIHLDPWTECSRKTINGPYATLAFDQEGVLYVAFYASDPKYAAEEALPLHIFLARSEDGGRTFETNFVWRSPEPVEEDEGLHNNDRPMVAVDETDPSNVYVGWMQRGVSGEKSKALVAASNDGGRSFDEPVDLTDDRGGYQPRLAVTPDGTLHAIYPIGLTGIPEGEDPFKVVRTLYHRRSTDGGKTWSERVEVDHGNSNFFGGRKFLLAADDDEGNLYAVWYANPEPHFDPVKEDVDIFLRVSEDGGKTWSERRVLNDEPPDRLVNHYDPGISVAPNGRIDVAWYDFRNSPYPERFPDGFAPPFNHDGFQDVYYTWSTDGGQTFHPNVKINDRIINREIGVWSNNIHSHMSVGIASTDNAAYFAWQDTRNGNDENQAEDVYFAPAYHSADTAVTEDPKLMWAIIGSGVALAIGGVVLLIGTRMARKGREEPKTVPETTA